MLFIPLIAVALPENADMALPFDVNPAAEGAPFVNRPEGVWRRGPDGLGLALLARDTQVATTAFTVGAEAAGRNFTFASTLTIDATDAGAKGTIVAGVTALAADASALDAGPGVAPYYTGFLFIRDTASKGREGRIVLRRVSGAVESPEVVGALPDGVPSGVPLTFTLNGDYDGGEVLTLRLEVEAGGRKATVQLVDDKPLRGSFFGMRLRGRNMAGEGAASASLKLTRLAFTPRAAPPAPSVASDSTRGFQGIWFALGQVSRYGDKYSGGLGTYTANHNPIAIHAPEVNKTFFVYGGARADGERYLVSMASSYDHATARFSKPVVVHDHAGVDDPHDNPSLTIAPDGRLWVFVSGRGTRRPGRVYRGVTPYDASAFEPVGAWEFTYPQPMHFGAKGFVLMHTVYENGRNRHLFVSRSADGETWSRREPLARLGGHYQVSARSGDRIGTFFNRHPGGDVDRRTDLYYMQSDDLGRTWATASGRPLDIPLNDPENPARVRDLASEGKLMYGMDLNFDAEGRPVLLYLTSSGFAPGPGSGGREWWISRWTGTDWTHHPVATSSHNYDMGSLLISTDGWRVVGPTRDGPQKWGAGGELDVWLSHDQGATWHRERMLTEGSPYNHNYVRRVVNGRSPFELFWADGDPGRISPSRLYMGATRTGEVGRLPAEMPAATAKTESVSLARGR